VHPFAHRNRFDQCTGSHTLPHLPKRPASIVYPSLSNLFDVGENVFNLGAGGGCNSPDRAASNSRFERVAALLFAECAGTGLSDESLCRKQ